LDLPEQDVAFLKISGVLIRHRKPHTAGMLHGANQPFASAVLACDAKALTRMARVSLVEFTQSMQVSPYTSGSNPWEML
jgi:hypothetical protein